MTQEEFERDPREYLADLIEQDIISKERMLELILCRMTKDDIKDMLEAEELSPRFLFEEDTHEMFTGEFDGQPDEAQEWHDFDPDC